LRGERRDPSAQLDEGQFVQHCDTRIKTITKIGNSCGLILDDALLQLARLKVGDQVNVEVHSGVTITITAIRPAPRKEEIDVAIAATMDDYAETLAKLAK
jgi:antitoxin component of MazEF toxin-antitoxin module